jgi:hypothetical protein
MADQLAGRPHIVAFHDDGILIAAIFLRSMIIREAAAQLKGARRSAEPGSRLSQSIARRACASFRLLARRLAYQPLTIRSKRSLHVSSNLSSQVSCFLV